MTLRQPATANLMLDSADRTFSLFGQANFFQINKANSILNGFFNRIGTTELVLEWKTPNFLPQANNMVAVVDLSGAGAVTGSTTFTGTLDQDYPQGLFINVEFYAQLIEVYLNAAGAATTPPTTWVLANPRPGVVSLTPNQPVWVRLSSGFFQFGGLATSGYVLIDPAAAPPNMNDAIYLGQTPGSAVPDLRPVRYLDFVSNPLTYNQDLKDASTAPIVRDVLARWYMAYDNYTAVDGYGFPILMGYEPFVLRRIFSPPKQIRWDNIQPVGQLEFQVYNDAGVLQPMLNNTNWLMTLQVSEN